MANNTNGNQFRDDEIIVLDQLRRDGEKWVKSIHPKIGGRLRLAHEQNQQISITTEIIRYDESVAVVRAVTTTMKGSFPGVEMASVEKDHTVVGNRDRVFTWDHCRVTHSLQDSPLHSCMGERCP